jgi:outer membrane biosynthesis protein TonB
MKPAHRVGFLLLAILAIPSLAWPKEEILPGKKGKSRDSQAQENPLYGVADDMGTVARRLNEVKTDDTTQEAQEAIIEKLDKLIEQAQQNENQPKGGQGDQQKPQQRKEPKPQPKSKEEQEKERQEQQKQEKKPASAQEQKKTDRPGIGRPGQGNPGDPLHTDAEEWGNLPPAIRDQLLQTQGEGFPLKYRELLRRYYRELAKPRE